VCVLGGVAVHDEELGETVHAFEGLLEEERIHAAPVQARHSHRIPSAHHISIKIK
jgi:hypothetical protein